MLEGFGRDVRHALRALGRSPAFTFAAVAALALGIGATTAVFSVVNAVLLAPLGIAEPERVVMVANRSSQGLSTGMSATKLRHVEELDGTLEQVAAFNEGVVNYTGGAFPEQLRSLRVTSRFFACLRAPVALGRTFDAAEDLPHAGAVVVLSRAFWLARFDGDRGVIGRTISLGGEPHEVIGVLGDLDLSGLGDAPQVFLPFPLEPGGADHTHYFRVLARLAPGVSLEQARAHMDASRARFDDRYPGILGDGVTFTVEPIGDILVRGARGTLGVLAGAVALVLLIACGNVAHLLLARATAREREVALRCALGGSRRRIARQLLTESLALALLGGVLGTALGVASIRVLLAINTADLPRIRPDGAIPLDWRVLVFALAVSITTGLVFGALPAWQGSRADLTAMLKEGGARGGGGGVRHQRLRAVMVVSEIALALVLLVGSALLIRTAAALQRVDPGIDLAHTLTLRTSIAEPRFASSEAVERMVRNGAEELRALPGVEQASASCCVPLQGGYGLPFLIVGRPAEGPFHGSGAWSTVSPGFFDALGIPVVRGRAITERDDGKAPPVVIINEALARQFWPGGDPIGQRLVIGRGVAREFAGEPEREIVGVVADTRAYLALDPPASMYIPQAQLPDAVNALNSGITPLAWVVRTRSDPRPLIPAIEEQLRQATGLPVTDARAMSEVFVDAASRQRFNMWLLSAFAGAALLLAAIGIYGLLAYSVEQRRREIGIRVAIGAEAAQVRGMVVRQGLRLALMGVAIGIVASLAATRSIARVLFGVSAWDPVAFTVVPIVLLAVSWIAVWLPARRASLVDPIIALRYE